MDSIIKETLKDLKIGESRIEFEGDRIESNNIQSVLLQVLYGKEIRPKVPLSLYMTNCGSFLINYSFHTPNNHKMTSLR